MKECTGQSPVPEVGGWGCSGGAGSTAFLCPVLMYCSGRSGLWIKAAQSGSLNWLEVIADPHRPHYLLQAPWDSPRGQYFSAHTHFETFIAVHITATSLAVALRWIRGMLGRMNAEQLSTWTYACVYIYIYACIYTYILIGMHTTERHA